MKKQLCLKIRRGGGDEALSAPILDSSNLEGAASPKEAETDSADKNEEATEVLQDKTADEEDITEESEEKPLAVKGSVEYFTYEGATITGLTEEGKQYFVMEGNSLEIPETNKDGEVFTAIGEGAFNNKQVQGKLEIPSHITKIGKEAFANNKLTSVLFSGNIIIDEGAFQNNEITFVDFGANNKIAGKRWSKYRPDSDAPVGCIPADGFRKNKIKELAIPSKFWAIGEGAFAENLLEELEIPSTIRNIYCNAFEKNSNLKKLSFLRDDKGNGVVQIDKQAFYHCAIEGSLEFPKGFNEMGWLSFAENKIEGVKFQNDDIIFGGEGFYQNRIMDFEVPLLQGNPPFDGGSNLKSNKLKNLSFVSGFSTKNIEAEVFKKNYLRSVKIPMIIESINNTAFQENTGWYEGTSKVALYRVKDVTAENPEYVTDNSLADGDSYVINPVLMELEFYDKEGKKIPNSKIDFTKFERPQLKIERGSIQAEIENGIDYENFKIGDRLELTEGKFSFQGSQKNIELAGDLLKDESYGDGYVVGYKKVVLKLKYNGEIPGNSNPPVPNPPTPDPKPIPEPTPNPFIPPIIETPIESTEIEENKVPLTVPEIEEEPVILDIQEEDEIEENETPRTLAEEELEEERTPLLNIPKTGEQLTSTGYFRLISIVMLSVVFVFTLERKKRMR